MAIPQSLHENASHISLVLACK